MKKRQTTAVVCLFFAIARRVLFSYAITEQPSFHVQDERNLEKHTACHLINDNEFSDVPEPKARVRQCHSANP
jgi:hypothetical protein